MQRLSLPVIKQGQCRVAEPRAKRCESGIWDFGQTEGRGIGNDPNDQSE